MYLLLRLVLLANLSGLLLVIVWSLDRGLDITDESMSLLAYLHPDEYPATFSMYYVIVSRATGWMHPTVLGYRWLTLALAVLAALAFTYGFCQWLRQFFGTEATSGVDVTLVLPFVLIGHLSAYGLGVRTLNYNSINNAFLFSACGLLLHALSHTPRRGVRPVTVAIALFIVGVLVALDMFVKFPTAIIMFGAALLLIVLHTRRLGPREVAIEIGILTLGIVGGLTAYFASVQSIAEWLSNYRAALQASSEATHNPGTILRSYAQDGESLARVLIFDFSPAFLLSFLVARCYVRGWHRKALRNQFVLLAVLAAALVYTGHKVYALDLLDSPYLNHFVTFYTYVLIICFEVIVLAAIYRSAPPVQGPNQGTARRIDALPGVALLAALPFAGAFGTANSIFLNAMFGIGAWFALIMIAGLLIKERTQSKLALSLCILLPTCFGPAQIVYGTVWKPYLLAASLPDHTVALDQPASVAGLRVDPATAEFIAELRSTLRQGSFRERDYILALYNAPGLVYLMGGVSPGTPTYFDHEQPTNCHALETTEIGKRAVFVLATGDVAPQTVACMQKAGRHFPDEFVELGRIYNSYSASPYGWRAAEKWVRVFHRKASR
jgi:hypothetical protein